MTNHVRNHEVKTCQHCTQPVSRANWARHHKSCVPHSDVTDSNFEYIGEEEEEEEEEKTEEVIRGEPLYRPPPTNNHRHPNRAPTESEFSTNVEKFAKWITSDTALGKSNGIRQPKSFMPKFRTVLGKLAAFHKIETATLMKRLNRGDTCLKMFQPKDLNEFTMQLENHVDGNDKKLNKSTVYNYLRALVVYLTWRVNILEQVSLKPSLTLLDNLAQRVSM